MSVAEAKDWINMICTVFQSLLALIAFVLVSVYWKMKDRKEEKRKLDRELREKIADLFSQDFVEIEKTFENFQKTTSSLTKQQIIVDAAGNTVISAHHVLKYMCLLNKREEYKTKALEEFCSDVEKMMKVFRTLRIKLPPIARGRKCPVNIKEELGQTIIEIGNSILPFVSETKEREKTINEVLKYFDVPPPNTNSGTPLQSTGPGHTPLCTRLEALRDLCENLIPYLHQFRMDTEGEITFKTNDMFGLNSHIINVAYSLEKNKPEMINRIPQISEEIKRFLRSTESTPDLDWSPTATNVLHFLRLVIYKRPNNEEFKELESYLMRLDTDPLALNADSNAAMCGRTIDDIVLKVNLLKGNIRLLRRGSTAEILIRSRNCLDEILQW